MRTSTLRTLIPAGVLAVLVLATLNVSAHAAELAGATLPDALSAGDKLLKLNGLGLRKKAMFKVYVGGLYLAIDPIAGVERRHRLAFQCGMAAAIIRVFVPRPTVGKFARTNCKRA